MNLIIVGCTVCGKKVERQEWKVKHYKRIFCSSICRGEWLAKNFSGKNSPRYKHGLSKGSRFICLNCKKKCMRNTNFQKYCSSTCQLNYEYKTGVRNPNNIAEKAHAAVRKLAAVGKLPAQQHDYKVWRAELRQKNGGDKTPSKAERIMEAHLIGHGIEFIKEMAFDVYNVDFAIPSSKSAVEVSSGNWHQSKTKRLNDTKKNKLLEKAGWKVYYNECPLCGFLIGRTK